ncbi:ATP-binding cassette domain-containing protein [Microlunatus parietis]|uniref:Oleandomycin transport system ATP-binding protein n=1 Tax=Microlunatus parietis TaxID=682979 RepID=A0A7Y9IBY9_9ACTN|nr:ATP-binding cassette domain-containing protein [Microlunatus parietis]NYE74022.1 oleandomycin transport system ATP-binding protein [Microlunatus parietis]
MSRYGIEAEGLSRRFGRTTALDGVGLSVERGRVLGLLGPNGAGKTTAIRILATLVRPDGGRASVAGFDVVRQQGEVRRRIALSGQHTSVDEELTGRANLIMIGRLLDLPRQQAVVRAGELLDRFGLAEAGDRPAAGYSGGMRRRLDLAASLVGRPEVIFLDEPSVGLDPGKRDDLWQLIRGLRADGVTVLLTTQYLEEADALADEITVIDHGRVIAEGTPDDLKARVGGRTVEVRLVDPATVDQAAKIIAAVTRQRPEHTGRQLRLPITDDAEFFEIAARLRDESVAVTELALRLPSLDEAFHALTNATPTEAAS